MKKWLILLSLLLCAALIGSTTVFAADRGDDIYAVATTVDGEEIILPDAPAADRMEALEGYELVIENEPALTVEQAQTPVLTADTEAGGYFSADFTLPDTQKQVYLVGLSADKVEEIQGKIIANYANGANFRLSDLSFIDAEKLRPTGDGDDYLCWAATASNLLTYTGWAAQAGFDSSDDVFESFINAFTDNGGNPYYAAGWFFNGVNSFEVRQPGVAATATAGTGGYLTDYAYEMLTRINDILSDPVGGMSGLYQSLRDGMGAGLSLNVYHNGTYTGGHAITCWGTVADTAYAVTEPEYYAGLFVTDSDSDEPRSGDRRDAVNNLQAVSLTAQQYSGGTIQFEFDLDSQNHAILREYVTLTPYSPELEKETSSAATRDKVNTPDLTIDDFYLSTDLTGSDYELFDEKIESNTKFYYTPVIKNEADVTYNGTTRISAEITDASGGSVYNRTFNTGLQIPSGNMSTFVRSLTINSGLPEGDYTFTCTLNSDHRVSEAYYYNNTLSFPLKVRDSYLLGDADGNGEINIMDATRTQRIVAGFSDGADGKARQRAAVSGSQVGIMDATQIQRSVAGFTVNYPIGEKQLYD